MRFRVRSKLGLHTITGSPSTLGELHSLILSNLGLSSSQYELTLKFGYPLQTLTAALTTPLSLLGLAEQDALLVAEVIEKPSTTSISIPKEFNVPIPVSSTAPPLPSSNPSSTSSVATFSHSPNPLTSSSLSSSKSTSATHKLQNQLEEESVEASELGGVLVIRPSPDDNHCLFHCISYLLDKTSSVMELRKEVIQWIQANPQRYSEAILGKPIHDYCQWILKPTSWGGAIELAIFSEYYQIEIDSVDIQTLRIDKFGEQLYTERVIVLYNGIHYDSIALAPSINAEPDFDTTRFSAFQPNVLTYALTLASNLHKQHRYTDQTNFTLRCAQCQSAFVGQKEALEHATLTGHTQFEEYK